MSFEATLATWELTKSQINSREKLLLLSLARRAGEDHTCWPSVKRIVEDTGMDRKTIIEVRQCLIDKKLIKYTGRMVGRSGQIPEMKLLYVDEWEQKRNSPRVNDDEPPVDKTEELSTTSPKNGTGTSTENGTRTSPKNGTLNSKDEYVSRNKKAFNATERKKIKEQNAKRHEFADSMDQMACERKHIAEHEQRKRAEIPQERQLLINR